MPLHLGPKSLASRLQNLYSINMSRVNRVLLTLLLATLLVSPACAQKGKWGKQTLKAVTAPNLGTHIRRTVLNAAKRPDIRLSVARLDHAISLDLPMDKRPHSTAFLLSTAYKGQKEIWAVTAGHTAQLGEKLRLTFYNGETEIPVDGTLVQQGPALLSDAALIRLDSPIPAELRPLQLSTDINPQEKLTTWGYASNTFYQLNHLTFEKDNTRFIRTDFPATQKKRSGLCGGPLLNAQGQALGIHCGTSLEDKSYAASVRIIPYLLQAYHEGHANIPVIAKGVNFGSIGINERIVFIQCMDEQGNLINQENVYGQLPQSLIMALYQDPEVRYMRFLLDAYQQDLNVYRVLVYDKKTGKHFFEPLQRHHKLF